jgi:PAS domain S-box-containing protein
MTAREHRGSALVFTGLLAIGALAGWIFWPLPARWPWVLTGAVDISLLALLVLLGPRPGPFAHSVIAVGAAVTIVQTWITNELAMTSSVRFGPFEGYKLLAIALALMAPSSWWLGLGAISATAVFPVVQTYLWSPAVRHRLPAAEPWMTVFYSVAALALFFFRRRQLEALGRAVRVETRASEMERSIRKLLAVRDLANSPLQSIETTLAVLRIRHPESLEQLDRIERQFDRLRTLSTVLSRYEPHTWTADARSFDPLEVLQQLEDSPTNEFDRLLLMEPEPGESGAVRGGGQENLEQLLRFTSFGLEHSPVCAFWFGQDGRLVYVNQAACESLGYSRSELLGMHISSFAPRVSRDAWPRRFESFRRQPTHVDPYPSVHRRKDGTLIPVEISASYAELNGRGYILGFAREIASRELVLAGLSLAAGDRTSGNSPAR